MKKKVYDFSGWATTHGIKCSDGKTIIKDAFKENDGQTVPLVWNHNHGNADNVLGHAVLENREQGVYAYCSFNNTKQGQNAKELVQHGDIGSLSIYANKLKQNGDNVVHGIIREVSLVLAGANPGAHIDYVLAHGEVSDEEAYIYNSNEELDIIIHANKKDEDEEKDNNMTQKEPVEPNIQQNEQEVKVEKTEVENPDETIAEIFETLTEKQKTVVFAMICEILDKEANKEETKEMKQNAFENQNDQQKEGATLTHSEFLEIIKDAKKDGSVRDAFIAHGITDVETLFPEARSVTPQPKVVDIENDWVKVVMNGVKHTPFSRIKSTYATLTADEARALGYVKGSKKTEEVLVAAKRTTTPTTIYKLQKLDRDDVLDITDFDVVAWIKQEMRGKLEQELARAILVGDGRSASSDDKINEGNIRPIASDSSVYTIKKEVGTVGATVAAVAALLIDDSVISMESYKGAGNITMFVRRDVLSQMLLLKDAMGHRIYKDMKDLALAMLVKHIVPVPASVLGKHFAISIDLSDYNVGADKGGAVNMFDDFDINYNKMEYLIETRCSGANVTPYSAVVFTEAAAAVPPVTPPVENPEEE